MAIDEFLVVLVVLVRHPVLDRAGRVGGQEGLRHLVPCERRLEAVDILLQVGLADIAERPDADRHGRRAGKARARIGLEIGCELVASRAVISSRRCAEAGRVS